MLIGCPLAKSLNPENSLPQFRIKFFFFFLQVQMVLCWRNVFRIGQPVGQYGKTVAVDRFHYTAAKKILTAGNW